MPINPLAAVLTLLALAWPAGAARGQAAAAETDSGVTLRVYQVQEDLLAIPDLAEGQTPNVDRLAPAIDLAGPDFGSMPPPIVTVVRGELLVAERARYQFRLTSDDGSRMHLGGRLIIDNDGRHAPEAVTSAWVSLAPGAYPLLIEHFDHAGERMLRLEWRGEDDRAFEVVPTEALRTERDLTRVTSPGVKQIRDGRRPGDGKPLEGVHPGWTLTTIRPPGFEPKVGAMVFDADDRLIIGTFDPLQRDDRSLPDIESKPPDVLHALANVTSGDPDQVEATVCAEGFYEPAGMCALGDDLYVAHRREVTRLRDADGDGFFETHDTVASGWEAWNYHQFCFGLVERGGLLYTALSTAMAPPGWEGMGTNAAPNGPLRGSILEIDPSSGAAHAIAGGTRTPNGLAVGPENTLFYFDNQGTWMPTSQMAEVIPGRFYGHYNRTNPVPMLADRFPEGAHPSDFCDRLRTPAGVFLPQNEVSNSPTQAQLIPDGPFAGQMLMGELTAGGIRRIFLENVNGQWQGAVFRCTQGLEAGVNRLVWGPDGALYAGGIGAGGNWNWKETKFGLQRLAPTGRLVFEMHSVSATPDGLLVRFTKPVERAWLADTANYSLRQWRYEPTVEYGGPKVDLDVPVVLAAEPAADGLSVRLRIDRLRQGHCIHVRTDPTSLDGEPIWSTEAWYTLVAAPAAEPLAAITLAGESVRLGGVGVGVLPPADGVPLVSGAAAPVFKRTGTREWIAPAPRTQDDYLSGDAFIEAVESSGDLVTTTVFGDARLHVEWYCPPGGEGQLAANSGVYLQDRYEIQVLGTPPGEPPPGDREAGAIYALKAADVNASTGPATWQAYDIWFRAPRFQNGLKTEDARATVLWNGRLIHHDVAIPHPTGSRRERGESASGALQTGPLVLQAHTSGAQGPVRFRNVWIAPLTPQVVTPGPWIDLLDKAGEPGEEAPLPGWAVRGGDATFRLDGSELVGVSRPGTPNTFLVMERPLGDFDLLIEVKQDPRLNSGIQIRSRVEGGFGTRAGPVTGYQVELDPSPRAWTGGLYDEQGRGWLHPLTDAPYARRAYRPGEWNRLRVTAQGPLIRTWVNGVPAASVLDAAALQGHLALQVHSVGEGQGGLEVRFRNLRLRRPESAPAGSE